jgi:hypothetical protein
MGFKVPASFEAGTFLTGGLVFPKALPSLTGNPAGRFQPFLGEGNGEKRRNFFIGGLVNLQTGGTL